MAETTTANEEQIATFVQKAQRMEAEIGKVIVGQRSVVREVLIALLAGGHVLLEGVPGLGKTLLVRTLGEVLDLKFSRIQFTPDLMPADIVGTQIVAEDEAGRKSFRFQPGPIFANLVLADEINRATPKTQSALLEAMQERQVSVGNATRPLPQPFFVLATQNPLEMEGTYVLPEAQLDRFIFKVQVPFPEAQDLKQILQRTIRIAGAHAEKVIDGSELQEMMAVVREVPVAEHLVDWAVQLILATHPDNEDAPAKVKKYVRYGASPRGLQALVIAAQVRALLEGRYNVALNDLREVAHPALRHRVVLNFEGQAEGLSTDGLLDEIIAGLPVKAE